MFNIAYILQLSSRSVQVTSHQASQSFHDKIQAASKKIVLFPVRLQNKIPQRKFSSLSKQGGYHELQNEPDGVKEKLVEEIVSFIDDRLASSTTLEEAEVHRTPETTNPADVTESSKAKM